MKPRLIIILLFITGFAVAYFLLSLGKSSNKETLSFLEHTNIKLKDNFGSIEDLKKISLNKEDVKKVEEVLSPDLKKEIITQNESAEMILYDVPFTAQAPFGEWDDPRQQDACEEASVLMAARWVDGRSLNKLSARRAILKATKWEDENFGFSADVAPLDVKRLLQEYFKVKDVEVKEDVSVGLIKKELDKGRVILLPMNGQKLGNPYFTGNGPERHMLLVRGYDEASGEFITNDPGTRHGKGYRYPFQTIIDSIRVYPSGNHQPILEVKKAMISVGKMRNM